MFHLKLCCCIIEDVVLPETPTEVNLRLAKEEIHSLQKKYDILVGRKVNPDHPSLDPNMDLPAATAMITSLNEKIKTMTEARVPDLTLRDATATQEEREEINQLRAEYDALQPSSFVPLSPHLTRGAARTQIANLRLWIADFKARKAEETRIRITMVTRGPIL